jgi:hypothetical protein
MFHYIVYQNAAFCMQNFKNFHGLYPGPHGPESDGPARSDGPGSDCPGSVTVQELTVSGDFEQEASCSLRQVAGILRVEYQCFPLKAGMALTTLRTALLMRWQSVQMKCGRMQ